MVDKMLYKSLYKAFIQLGEFNNVPSVVPAQQNKVQAESISKGKGMPDARKVGLRRQKEVKWNQIENGFTRVNFYVTF